MTIQSANIIVPTGGQFPMVLGSVYNWIRITRILTRSTLLPILAQIYSGATNYAPASSQPLVVGDVYYPTGGFTKLVFDNTANPGPASFTVEVGQGTVIPTRFLPRLGDWQVTPRRAMAGSSVLYAGPQAAVPVFAASVQGVLIHRMTAHLVGTGGTAGSVSFSNIPELTYQSGPDDTVDIDFHDEFYLPAGFPSAITLVGAGSVAKLSYTVLGANQDNYAFGPINEGGG